MIAKCPCNHCDENIEFATEEFISGSSVACPHCGMETMPFLSPPSPTRPLMQEQSVPDTIFCPKCGEKNRGNNFKCVRCGFALHTPQTSQPAIVPSSVTYEVMSDKIGLVPNIKKKDNVFQALFTLAFTIVGTLIGLVGWGGVGAGIGALAGISVGGLISGVILCVVGLTRK
jgi:DNA-directed RNA polymerase subunit RPC12/RpoP